MENIIDSEMDPEIASAMGFSAFGGQPNKKRKYNHNLENAAAAIDDPRGKSSGANTTELGIRNQNASNENEGTEMAAARAGTIGRHPEGASAGLSQFITHAQSLPPRPGPPRIEQSHHSPTRPTAAPSSFPTGVPAEFFDKMTWKDLEALRKGVKDANGDVAYFLPSFIEDPWAKLEREKVAEKS